MVKRRADPAKTRWREVTPMASGVPDDGDEPFVELMMPPPFRKRPDQSQTPSEPVPDSEMLERSEAEQEVAPQALSTPEPIASNDAADLPVIEAPRTEPVVVLDVPEVRPRTGRTL